MTDQPRILLLGPPGAGKGTQSTRLADRYGVDHVTTGGILRANKDMQTDHGTPREYMEAGELVPDPVVDGVVAEALADRDGFVLDGYPRTLDQAEALAAMTDLDAVVFLEVPDEVIVERLAGRRVCPECDATYHVDHDPPAESGTCDECGAAVERREDDAPDAVEERLRVYDEETAPVVERYRERGVLATVDGDQPPDDVFTDLVDAVETARDD